MWEKRKNQPASTHAHTNTPHNAESLEQHFDHHVFPSTLKIPLMQSAVNPFMSDADMLGQVPYASPRNVPLLQKALHFCSKGKLA